MAEINLLIVDDEERFLKTTKTLLEKKGLKTLTAPTGKDALEILDNSQIDVVILDIKMPGIDGIRVLKKIKEKFPLIEVIILTGHSTVKSAAKGIKLGAFDYLMKPCDIQVLYEQVTSAYARKKAMESNKGNGGSL